MKQNRWFTKIPIEPQEREVEKEIMLWRAVIDQQLEDFFKRVENEDDRRNKEAAEIWLRCNTEDFQETCNLAHLNAALVKEAIFRLIELNKSEFKS